jgi:hypothetical protein
MTDTPDPLRRRLGLSPGALKGAWLVAAGLAAFLLVDSLAQPRIEWQRDPVLPSRHPAAAERIDPTTASKASLVRLPGVGPATAEAIIQRRRSQGPSAVATEEGLLQVPNIGPLRLKKMRPHLHLADPCTADHSR